MWHIMKTKALLAVQSPDELIYGELSSEWVSRNFFFPFQTTLPSNIFINSFETTQFLNTFMQQIVSEKKMKSNEETG